MQPQLTFFATTTAGILALIFGAKLKIPSIFFLLTFGILLGPQMLGWVQPQLLQSNLPPLVSLMVALILFEGGSSLKFSQLREVSRSVRNLLTVGVAVTLLLTAWAAHLIAGMGWDKAVLFGAIMTVSGPTVVLPILRRLRVQENLHNILKWEAILIDPLGVVLTVVIFEFLVLGHGSPLFSVGLFVSRIMTGAVLGLAAGWLMVFGLTQPRMLRTEGEELGGLYVLGLTLFFFGISEMIFSESGLVTVTVAGIYFGNQKFPFQDKIDHFKDQVVLFALSVLFILLAASVPVRQAAPLWREGLILLLVMIFVIRPLAVLASTWGDTKLQRRERLFLAALAPRGIVSATLASLFSLAFEERMMTGRGIFLPLSFMVITGTILFYTIISPLVSRLLKVREGNLRGVIIVGAGRNGLEAARILMHKGFNVRLIDTSDFRCSKARKAGFTCFEGSGFDTDFLESLDIKGVGTLLAMTPNHEVNVLCCQVFTRYVGRKGVFRLWDPSDTWQTVSASTYDESWGRPLGVPQEALPASAPLLNEVAGSLESVFLDTALKVEPGPGLQKMGGSPVLAFMADTLILPFPGSLLPAGAEVYFMKA